MKWIIVAILVGLIAFFVVSGNQAKDAKREHAAATAQQQPWMVMGRQGQGARFIVMDGAHAADKGTYIKAAQAECPIDWCQAMFWTDINAAAGRIPMNDDQSRAMVASFNRNRATGLERWNWSCAAFPGTPASECFTPDW